MVQGDDAEDVADVVSADGAQDGVPAGAPTPPTQTEGRSEAHGLRRWRQQGRQQLADVEQQASRRRAASAQRPDLDRITAQLDEGRPPAG